MTTQRHWIPASTLLLLLVGASGLGAQDNVSCNFQVFMWPMAGDGVEYTKESEERAFEAKEEKLAEIKYERNNEVVAVAAPPRKKSETYRYNGPARLDFFREVDDGTGSLRRVAIGSVTLSKGTREYLLVFKGKSEAKESFSILPLPTSTRTVGQGKGVVYNLTRDNLAAKFGEVGTVLAPLKSMTVNLTDAKKFRYPIEILTPAEGGSGWEKAYKRKKVIRPDSSLVFFIHRNDGGAIQVITLDA